MSDFDLFDQILLPLQQELSSLPKSDLNSENGDCLHENVSDNSGIVSCLDCGEELGKNIAQDKEWRYYGQSDTKHKSDPSRCQLRKVDDKSILKDIEKMGFSDRIVNVANNIYLQVTSGRIHRGNSRKAIIFACIFHAYKICDNPQSCDTLIDIFNIDRKAGLKGLKYVTLNMPKETSVLKNVHITPVNLIEEIMNKFSANREQKNEVIAIYDNIKDKSIKINRARPQSIAAGITYYWICQKEKKISIAEFMEKVGLSELTITRIAKEITELLCRK